MFSSVNSSGDALECENQDIIFSETFKRHQSDIEANFLKFTKDQQINLVQGLLKQMSHYQHGQIDAYLKPMLQRDFITDLPAKGLFQVSEQILTYLDAKSLCSANQVSYSWRQVIREGYLWKKLIEHMVLTNSLWRGLGERCGWINKLSIPGRHIHPRNPRNRIFKSGSDSSGIYMSNNLSGLLVSPNSTTGTNDNYLITGNAVGSANCGGHTEFMDDNAIISGYELMDPEFYRRLYPEIIVNIKRIQKNWLTGKYNLKKIECHSESSKGVYCLQYDDRKIVSGLRDNSIKVWDARTLECLRVLTGHVGSVLCLQYDNNVIISGSSDSTVRVWSLSSWSCVNTIYHHCEAVLHLRFAHSILVTCSKDRSIAVWDMFAPGDIRLRRVLVGHRAAVNVVDFDQKNIVSASGDRTIKVWNTQSCEFLHTMNGHRRGIACLQYRNNLVVSGSSDNTIRLWQIETGTCLRTLEGHQELVRCIRFDSKYIVSGAYDGKIKVWDLVAALNPQSPANSLCLQTLNQHTGRVFRLQFDEFQIVSSSHDDTILIWDFLDTGVNQDSSMNMVRSPVVSLDNDDESIMPIADPVVISNNASSSKNLVFEYDLNVHDNFSMMMSSTNFAIDPSTLNMLGHTIPGNNNNIVCNNNGSSNINNINNNSNNTNSGSRSACSFNINSYRRPRQTPSKPSFDPRVRQSNDSLNESRLRPTFDNFLFDSSHTSITSDHDDIQGQDNDNEHDHMRSSSSRRFS